MKVSLNFINQFLDFDPRRLTDLQERIWQQLGAIEETVDYGVMYKDALVVKVVSASRMEESDHLNLCFVDDGGVNKDVDRQEDGTVQVVCGAPNVESGQLVVWLPPGSTVPQTAYDSDPFVLSARKIMGVVSNGMLASPKELALSDDHDGILVLEESDIKPGTAFSQVVDSEDDYIIDIENKMFTHRPDCFGLLGVAREISGIYGESFSSPDWYLKSPKTIAQSEEISIDNQIPGLVPRFSTAVIKNIVIKPSSPRIRSYLLRMGIRPVNNIVDITNLVMMITGQPMHAYDLNKLISMGDGLQLGVRLGREGDQLKLLNGNNISPGPENIVITSHDQPVGLGGVMGGSDTEVDDTTVAVVLESAAFDMYSIRRTSMGLGIFSDAVTRFNKGQSVEQTARCLNYALELVRVSCPDSEPSEIVDNYDPDSSSKYEGNYRQNKVNFTSEFVNGKLGTELSESDIIKLLDNVEIVVKKQPLSLGAHIPFWRQDIESAIDIVEEVGRLFGYQHIQPSDLMRSSSPVTPNPQLLLKSRIRHILSSAGGNEVLSYSLISERLLNYSQQSRSLAYEITNSVSPTLKYFRLSLTPSLLNKVNTNVKAGFDNFLVYELGVSHIIGYSDPLEPSLPKEMPSLAGVLAIAKDSSQIAPYYRMRTSFDFLMGRLQVENLDFQPLSERLSSLDEKYRQMTAPFEPSRSAVVVYGGEVYGVIGEYKKSVAKRLKLPASCAGFEVSLELFSSVVPHTPYTPIPRFPAVIQDITLKVSIGESYETVSSLLKDSIYSSLRGENCELSLLGIYKPDEKYLNYSFRLKVASDQKTYSSSEINSILDEAARSLSGKIDSIRV